MYRAAGAVRTRTKQGQGLSPRAGSWGRLSQSTYQFPGNTVSVGPSPGGTGQTFCASMRMDSEFGIRMASVEGRPLWRGGLRGEYWGAPPNQPPLEGS